MNIFRIIAATSILSLTIIACNKPKTEVLLRNTSESEVKVKDLYADTANLKKKTFFSLRENKIINPSDSATDKWDLAFMGVNIYVNGGTSGPGMGAAKILNGIFEEINETTDTDFKSDNGTSLAIPSGSNNGWYFYTGSTQIPNHVILPLAGKILIIRTADGKYAKLEILSYYKGAPNTSSESFVNPETRPKARFYTFRYIFQPNGTRKF